jgi:diguanylate cyclase (GGDEF)-like protein/PAS domain S-box-containing protein
MDNNIHILVAGDAAVLGDTATLLEAAGHTVNRASTAQQAMAAIHDHRPDLLLLDHDLPGTRTGEFCRQIKRDPALPDVFVVVISSRHLRNSTDPAAGTGEQTPERELDADAYIPHPDGAREMLANLEPYVRIVRLTRTLRSRESELRDSEQKYRMLFEDSPEAHVILVDGIIADCNKAAEVMLRSDRKQIIGKSPIFISPILQPNGQNSADAAPLMISKALQSGGHTFEWIHRRLDGSEFWAEVCLSKVTLDEKPALFVSWRDITERKEAEENVERHSALVGSLLDSIPDMIFFKDAYGLYRGCNPPFADFVGKSRNEIIGKSDYDLFSQPVADSFRQHDQRTLELGQPRHNEEWITYPDGRKALLDMCKTPYCASDGTLIGVLGVGRDITQLKQEENALRESDEKFHHLADNIKDVFWICSPDLHVMHYVSPGYPLVWGRSSHSLYADPYQWIQAILPDDRERVLSTVNTLGGDTPEASVEYRITRPDGMIRWIHDRRFQVRNAAGKLVRIAGIASDITERKHGEDRLRVERQNLKAIFAAAPVGMLLLDENTQIVDSNRVLSDIISRDPSQIIHRRAGSGLGCAHSAHSAQSEKGCGFGAKCPDCLLSKGIEQVLAGRPSVRKAEIQLSLLINGRVQSSWLSVSAEPVQLDGRRHVIVAIDDINARKTMEDELRLQQAELRQSKEELSATLESMGDGVITCDADGRVTNLNAAAATLIGWSTEQARGRLATDVFHILNAQTREPAEMPFDRALKEGTTVGLANHTVLVSRDGIGRHIADSCAPIRNDAGKVIGAVLVFHDVTAEYHSRDLILQANTRFNELARHSRTIYWEVNAQGCFTFASEHCEAVLGYTPAELVGKMRFYDLWIEERRQAQKRTAFKIFRRGKPFHDWENQVRAKDGRVLWMTTAGVPVIDRDGKVTGYRCFDVDITSRKETAQALLQKTALLQAQANSSADGMLVVDRNNRRILSNQRFFELFEATSFPEESDDDSALLQHFMSLVRYPESFLERIRYLNEHVNERSSDRIEMKNGKIFDRYSSPVLGKQGELYGRIWSFRDITAKEQAAEEMHKLSQVVEQISASVMITDLSGKIEYVNPAFTANYGYYPSEVVGRTPRIISSGLTSPQIYAHLWKEIKAGRVWHGEMQNRRRNGQLIWQLVNISPMRNGRGEPTHYVAVKENITALKTMEDKLRTAALTDKLTGLPNRALICDRMQQAVLRARRHKDYHFAVLFLDFDRFKTINDSLGHDVGDLLLKEIARRLRTTVRAGDSLSRQTADDTAARLGGDEFVVLLDGIASPQDATVVANRMLAAFAQPYHLGEHKVYSTASIGVVINPMPDESAEDVLRDADTAMYEAKLAGKGQYIIFDVSMRQRVQNRLNLENDLRNALEAHQLFLMYQPIVSLQTGRIEGFEALVRWQHPKRGLISPGEFIPIAEDTGLILPIGAWVLQQACEQFARWRQTLGDAAPRSISVNLSRNQLATADLPQTIRRILQETGMPADCLRLEVTESAVMKDTAAVIQVLRAIKEIGVNVDMDDFGTGYSSLACLHEFPIDVLKIDRSFIANIDRGRDFAALVQAMAQLARNLKIGVIAEGIETMEQAMMLQSLDCEFGQGFLFSKPLMAEDVPAFKVHRGILPSLAA